MNKNCSAFVGYCKAQAVRYSMRGERLNSYMKVVAVLEKYADTGAQLWTLEDALSPIEAVKFVLRRQPEGTDVRYLDVYGRQTPMTIKIGEALKVYRKPVDEAGKRAKLAQQADGADWKALYHAVRIAEQGLTLFKTGNISFPCQNIPFLMQIREGKMKMEDVLDYFDEKVSNFDAIAAKSSLADKPDREWIDGFVEEQYEKIVVGR